MLLLEKYFQNCQACYGRSECRWVKEIRISKCLAYEIDATEVSNCRIVTPTCDRGNKMSDKTNASITLYPEFFYGSIHYPDDMSVFYAGCGPCS